jgi:hypothetical protein
MASTPDLPPAVIRRYSVKLIAIAGVAALLVIICGVLVVRATSDDSHSAPRAVAPHTLAVADPGFVDSTRTDSDPVTATEFFTVDHTVVDLHPYTRLASGLEPGCPGLTGELATAVSGDRCRQLVRAIYLSEPDASGRRVLGAVSVLVLDEVGTAQNAAKLIVAGTGGIPALPVPAETLPGAVVTNPTGDNSWRAAPVSGHYLIALQLAYTNGDKGTASDPALGTVRRDLAVLASEPISRRALTGHGPR